MGLLKQVVVVRILQSVVGWGLLPLTISAAQITLDGSVGGPKGNLQGPNYAIGANMGRQVGTNLFHSFGLFNIHPDESATFTGPDAIRNVIGRVTGGQVSEIDGTLRSTMPNAALYLLNPAGVMFGPNATLEVPGSFHVSTADYLKLSDGGRFAATRPETSVLTSAPPAAFGFVGPNPAPITIQGSTLQAATEQVLSVVGGDVTMTEGKLSAPGGQVTVVSVGSAGEVSVPTVATTDPVTLSGFTRMGKLELKQGAIIDGSGEGGGGIELAGGQVTLRDGSVLTSTTQGTKAGRAIRVQGTEKVTLTGRDENRKSSRITSTTTGTGAAGNVLVQAPRVVVDEGGAIVARTSEGSTGRGGDVEVSGKQIDVLNGGSISGLTTGAGDAGTVTVTASERITMQEQDNVGKFSVIANDMLGTGAAGKVVVQAPRVEVDGGQIRAQAPVRSAGRGGDVEISGQQIDVVNGGSITSYTVGDGDAGTVTVTASKQVIVQGEDSFITSISESAGATGNVLVQAPHVVVDEGSIAVTSNDTGRGGDVKVSGQKIDVVNGGRVVSDTFGAGDAGTVTVIASEQITVQGQNSAGKFSTISSDSFGVEAAGKVMVQAPHVVVDGGGITAVSVSAGRGGDVEVSGQQIDVLNEGVISSDSTEVGDAGIVMVTASKQITVRGHDSAGNFSTISSNTQATFGTGAGGKVLVQAPHVVVDGGVITAVSLNMGRAGDVEVSGQNIDVVNGGRVASDTQGAGDAGQVTVTASERIMVQGQDSGITSDTTGAGAAGTVVVQAPQVVVDRGVITAGTGSTGKGGDVEVSGEQIDVLNGGAIASDTSGTGDAGMVTVIASKQVMVQGQDTEGESSFIDTDTHGAGAAGNVIVQAPQIVVDAGVIAAEALEGSTGRGGDVEVTGQQISVINEGVISSKTFGAGAAGQVHVTAREQVMVRGKDEKNGNFSFILSETSGTGAGGTVVVQAPRVIVDDGRIATDTSHTGHGGDVEVSGQQIQVLNGGEITSDTHGARDAGTVTIEGTERVIVKGFNSRGFASVISSDTDDAGAAGKVVVQAPQVMVDEGGLITASSDNTGRGGDVEVNGQQIQVLNGGAIASDAFGAGDAGAVTVTASKQVTVQGQNANGDSSIIDTDTHGAGVGGTVVVQAPQIVVDGGVIAAETFSTGRGGDVEVSGRQIKVINTGVISSSTSGAGVAGQVHVTASEQVLVRGKDVADGNFSFILSETSGGGAGGTVVVQAPQVVVDDGLIGADTLGSSTARGGDVAVSGQQISVINGGEITSDARSIGDAGTVRVQATEGVLLQGLNQMGFASVIGSDTSGAGAAGKVVVEAPQVMVDEGGVITARALKGSVGRGGNVEVSGRQIAVVNGGQIVSSTSGTGDAGTVAVRGTKEVTLRGRDSRGNLSTIASDTSGAGAAGTVTMQAPQMVVDEGGVIAARALAGSTGRGGDVEVSGQRVEAANGGTISSATLGAGAAGQIRVIADTLRIAGQDNQGNRSSIVASTETAGQGGDVNIKARTLLLDAGGEISATSTGSGDAGRLTVTVADALQVTDGRISTQAQQAGGGNITLQVGGILDMVWGELTTTVQGGSGNAGNITVTAPTVVLNNSTVRAKADAGKGGNIMIGAEVFLASSDSVVDASAGPAGVNGTVDIRGVISDLSGILKPLSQEYPQVAELAANRCAGRIREGGMSSFVVTGRGGIPVQPGGLLPSASLVPAQLGKTGRTETHQNSSLTEQYFPVTWVALNDGCVWTEGQ